MAAQLIVWLSGPAMPDLIETIEGIPSVLEIYPSRPADLTPMLGKLSVTLEEGADVDETAYLIESVPGVREVTE